MMAIQDNAYKAATQMIIEDIRSEISQLEQSLKNSKS